jgi:hypothetical protein
MALMIRGAMSTGADLARHVAVLGATSLMAHVRIAVLIARARVSGAQLSARREEAGAKSSQNN